MWIDAANEGISREGNDRLREAGFDLAPVCCVVFVENAENVVTGQSGVARREGFEPSTLSSED